MKRYVQIEGVLYERGTEPVKDSPLVMPDIKPYRSMIDGSLITSRGKHREHLRMHGYEEVGNDSRVTNPKSLGIPEASPEQRKELIRSQVDAMTHRQFKRALQRDLDRIKWNSRRQ